MLQMMMMTMMNLVVVLVRATDVAKRREVASEMREEIVLARMHYSVQTMVRMLMMMQIAMRMKSR